MGGGRTGEGKESSRGVDGPLGSGVLPPLPRDLSPGEGRDGGVGAKGDFLSRFRLASFFSRSILRGHVMIDVTHYDTEYITT